MSFYGRMASTASRLLTQYGKPVVLERITSVFNPITGMDTSRTVSESTTTGVEIPIRDALVDGTRVKVGDRFLIVDASIEPEMSDRLQDAPFVGYAIGLEPGAHYIVNLPSNAEVSGQTVSKTAPVGVDSFTTYSARSVQTFDTTTWDGHRRAVEFRIDTLSTSFPSSGLAEIIISEGSGGDALRVRYSTVTGKWTVIANGSAYGTVHSGALGEQIGVSIHAQSGDVTVHFASGNVDKQVFAPLGGLFHGSTLGIDVRGISVAGAGGTQAGDAFSATLVSDRTHFERTYVSTMRDWNGTLLTEPAMSESSAIVAIEPISPAGVPVAYRLQVRK
jgi:hypothetical protein